MEDIQPRTADRSSWPASLSEDEALAMIGHLLSSAECCLYEPELYGSFRLLDATSRLIGMLMSREPAQPDPFLRDLKQQIDQKKVWMMYDRSGYRDFVQEAPVLLARRLQERARAERGE
ncbi:MAG TPA: DUF6092 family protein [Chloroflexota bacterium]|nr:DUF6092 family protein [Chloroflexota bacterium]